MAKSHLLDRKHELGQLEAAWQQAQRGAPQLVALWGRRRVGKTFLLSHFAGARRTVFYTATQQAERVELGRLGEAVRQGLGEDALDLAGGTLSNWEAALRYFAALAQKEPLLVVLDEVPYLAHSTPGFASIVQTVWDHLQASTRLMLVLTGSAIGTVERMLGGRGPLRGRPTLQLRLDPVTLTGAREFLPKLEADQLLEAYAACGGYPLHLLSWDQNDSSDTNLLRLAGSAGGILLEDAESILEEELADSAGYARVLAAIGRGRTRYSEIANEAQQRVEYPIETLTRTGYVAKQLPVGSSRGARPSYQIADPYLAFWFSVLYADRAEIYSGQGRVVLRRRKPQWQRQLGATFEAAARGHARRLVKRSDLPQLLIGRWWASKGQPCEVDVLGLEGAKTRLLGEVKWQNKPLGRRELATLKANLQLVPQPVDRPLFALWGRNGVDPDVLDQADSDVVGFDIEDVIAES